MRTIDADALKEQAEIVPLTFDGGIDINDFEKMADVYDRKWMKHDKKPMRRPWRTDQ